MTEQQRLIRVAALMTILRDDLEEMDLSKELKNKSNMWLKCANKNMTMLTSMGEDANEELIKVTQDFEEMLKPVTH